MKYVAFLRGINTGKKQVKMDQLRKVLEEQNLTNVKTILASGNIIFETTTTTPTVEELETTLKNSFGFEIPVILRTFPQIQKLIQSKPFKNISITPETRLYVTFLGNKPTPEQKKIELLDESFQIIQITDNEVCSVKILQDGRGTVDAMEILEKQFGKNVTTRNWNTITKIIQV